MHRAMQEKQYSAVASNANVFYEINWIRNNSKKLAWVLWEHLVGGLNPVAPTLIIQFLDWFLDLSF